jgi:hypothetical protein
MKGVIKTICPAAEILDLTHELKPFAVEEAAFSFGEAWTWFPKGTIHVVVIDPGVGSQRRPILVQGGGHSFVGPDNGVLTSALMLPGSKARCITNPAYRLPSVSQTFHGRDIFAPSAAHLAAGVRPAQLGKVVPDGFRLRMDPPAQTSKRVWTGVIRKIDRFGNCITNFRFADFPWLQTNPFSFSVGFEQVTRIAPTYSGCEYGELYALVGSSGYVEIVLREANAAKRLGVGTGAPVELTGWATTDL